MKWSPISEDEIWDKINSSYERMNLSQRRMWEVIKIMPEKWKQNPWGEQGGGFWIVAIIGQSVIWYNDIEYGFNRSNYIELGRIEEYCCNQDNLETAVQEVINQIGDGYASGGKTGAPEPIT